MSGKTTFSEQTKHGCDAKLKEYLSSSMFGISTICDHFSSVAWAFYDWFCRTELRQ